MAERYKCIFLFGGPGTGKGTQGEVIGAILGFFHCASGDIFRSIDPSTQVGQIFKDYSSRGELVPDDVTVRLWTETMQRWIDDGRYTPASDLLVLDGIPRTREQAQIMDEHIDVLQVIHLTCADRDAIVQRLKKRALDQGRTDDADENVIRNRWKVYDDESKPVIDHYDADKVASVEAIATPLQILCNMLAVIKPIHETHFGA